MYKCAQSDTQPHLVAPCGFWRWFHASVASRRHSLVLPCPPRERYARFAAGDGAFFFSEGDTVECALIQRLWLLLRLSHHLSYHLILCVCTLDGYFSMWHTGFSVQLPSLLHRRHHARNCCEDCRPFVCGHGKHGSFAFRGSGSRVLLSGLEKSLLLVPNASAARKCCSEHYVVLRSGSFENSDTSSEALDDHHDDAVTLTTVFSDESGVQVTGDAGLGVKHFRCPKVLFQSRASRHHHCWRQTVSSCG